MYPSNCRIINFATRGTDGHKSRTLQMSKKSAKIKVRSL